MATYYYASNYSTNATVGLNSFTGRPTPAAFNPYNTVNVTTNIVSNPQVMADAITAPFGTDDIDRSSFTNTTISTVIAPAQGRAIFVAGGMGSYRNAFGCAISNTPITDPDLVPLRYILFPNSHATTNGLSPGNNLIIAGQMTMPLPTTTAAPATIGADSQGTPIANLIANTYSSPGANVYYQFFFLVNAWVDAGTNSYVNLNAPLRWMASTAPGSVNQTRVANVTYATAPVFVFSSPTTAIAADTVAIGMEDLDAASPPAPDFANADFNDIVIIKINVTF